MVRERRRQGALLVEKHRLTLGRVRRKVRVSLTAVSANYLRLALSDSVLAVNSYAGKAPIHRQIPPPVTSGLLATIESEMRSLETLISVKRGMYRALEKERDEEVSRLRAAQAEEEKVKKAAKGKAKAARASTESADEESEEE